MSFALLNGVGQLFNCWILKQDDERERLAKCFLDLRKHPNGQQRRSAKRKKVILDPDALDAEQLGPNPAQLSFRVGTWPDIWAGR